MNEDGYIMRIVYEFGVGYLTTREFSRYLYLESHTKHDKMEE
jgi:hypothetical protein